ncbi:MAG: phospho-sugar mutase [Candidatus Sumerlaeota bacterium]|nr:phospho-sugar mutase [Candidatus Sumerlaeota bacterium]
MLKDDIASRIRAFTDGADAQTLQETVDLLLDGLTRDGGEGSITDAFYCDLDFGTGGLRGIMGAGTNRMNRVVVGRATQGLANYIVSRGGGAVCIAYDSRLRSKEFAREAARVVAGNGLKAYLFDDMRPTPELSFAVRHLKAAAGIVITASHNPKEYNGYKVSWSDGGQVVPPEDREIIEEVRRVTSAHQVKTADFTEAIKSGAIEIFGSAVDEAFLGAIDAVRMRPQLDAVSGNQLKIVYTPLHGTGIKMVPRALARWGYNNVVLEPQQSVPDGAFPTIKSPNPEDKAALELSIQLARRENADVVFATDPDADRIGIAVRHDGDYQLVTGNQVGALMAYYICETLREQGRLPANGALVTTVVTTGLISAIGADYGVDVDLCLTGFKWIAHLIRGYDIQGAPGAPSKKFLMGCEESYGYLIGTHARDKDSVVASCVLAEMALWAKTQGKTFIDVLHDLYARYGVHVESQLSKQMPGMTGMQKIAGLMESLRNNPPREIAGITVTAMTDIKLNKKRDLVSGKETTGPGLPESNVLIYALADGSSVVARPSGTEPKVKFYFMVVDREGASLSDPGRLNERIACCKGKEQALRADFDRLTSERM